MFYSISSTQPGLTGVDLGQFLIKKVAEKVKVRFACIPHCLATTDISAFASCFVPDKLDHSLCFP